MILNSEVPRLLIDSAEPLIYDFNEPDHQYVMFDRSLENRLLLPFSVPVSELRGTVTLHGRPIDAFAKNILIGDARLGVLALRLCDELKEYGEEAELEIRGFQSEDGAEMLPQTLTIRTPGKAEPQPQFAKHEAVSLQAAQDGIVLLKNDNAALPLREGERLNLFGEGVNCFRSCAVGAGKINPRYSVGLREAAARYGGGEPSDTAIYVLTRCSGENSDGSSAPGEYALTAQEKAELSALRNRFPKLAVVMNTGCPIGLAYFEQLGVDALVWNGFGGMLAGQALVDVLLGKVNPSGKLPDTWAARYEDLPSSRNFYDSADRPRLVGDSPVWMDTVYEEDLYVGYRYFETFWRESFQGYPFGHGLSYTSFSKQAASFVWNQEARSVTAAVAVANIGARAGREVVQLYAAKPASRLEQPARELVAFAKTRLLQPGELEVLTLFIPFDRLGSYDEAQAAWLLPAGDYHFFLGGSVREATEIASFPIEEDVFLRRLKNRMRPTESFPRLSVSDPKGTYPTGMKSGVKDGRFTRREQAEQFPHARLPRPEQRISFHELLRNPALLPQFVGGLDVKTLSRLSVCANHGWGIEGRGEAGRLCHPEDLDLPEMVVADGNSGVNLREKNIGFPSGVTLCASFDTDLMERAGRVIGEEAGRLGIDLILAPGMNLHRNPLCGRQPEYFSEDPYLAGAMAGYYCRGLESAGVGGCYKHLIANNCESARKRNQSLISERAIRELYFRAFAYALEVHEPVSVMTAYNAVNGLHTSCDPELIQGLLMEECGFRGFVMTDWTSYDTADVAEMAAAGISWITPGSEDDTYTSLLEQAVTDGTLPLEQLQENVLRIIRALLTLAERRTQGAQEARAS